MALTLGTRLGPYVIEHPLGAGGMGEVYRAKDSRLDRTVAIKVLPASVAADPELRQRFEREARAVAALNHPHICTLYDVGRAHPSPQPSPQRLGPAPSEDARGASEWGWGPTSAEQSREGARSAGEGAEIDFLVMEYLEGETLAQRLEKGALPLDQALQYAMQMADALDKAHRQGITHRDLKPANVILTKAGPKLLDFGLAKLGAKPAGALAGVSALPTQEGLTAHGTILGTFQYMAPEQLEGKEADARTDIFAFGAVLYEMVTGKKAFEGKSHASLISAIMSSEPPPISSVLETAAGERLRPARGERVFERRSASERGWGPASIQVLDRVVKKCLAKDPEARWHSAHDLHDELTWIAEAPSQVAPVTVAHGASRHRERLAWISIVAFVTLVALAIAAWAFRPVPPAPEMRLEITTPPTADSASLAISPNGQKIVCVATSEGQSRLWLRPLDSTSGRALAGTDGASFPFWSPDSQSVGFFAAGKLKRIDVDRGSVQILADAPDGRGGAWNRDGAIIFTPYGGTSAIFRIPATGGTPSPLTRTEATKETSHRFPQFLPDGHHFLYYVQGTPESHGIYAGDLDGSQARRLLDVDSAPVYASSGHLLFVRQGTLFAQEFDAARLVMEGSPFSLVVERIAFGSRAQGSAAVSASSAGPIVYRTASAGGQRQFVWFDRSGKEIAKAFDRVAALELSISSDTRRVGLSQQINNNFDIWLLDLGRGVFSRFTSDAGVDDGPIWSPDSRQIAFRSNRKGSVYDMYVKPAIGPGREELLLASAQDKYPTDWSPDGRFLLYFNADPKAGIDIWALPLFGDRKPFPVVQTNFEERGGQFSPDGKWIAYESNESGRFEIYIQPFPGPGGQSQVSTNGGAQVRWRRDGKELFYIALDGRLMAVPIRLASNTQTIEAGSPIPLFATRVGGALSFPFNQQYDVSSDGQRFLMNTVTDEEAAAPITVILNWKAKP